MKQAPAEGLTKGRTQLLIQDVGGCSRKEKSSKALLYTGERANLYITAQPAVSNQGSCGVCAG